MAPCSGCDSSSRTRASRSSVPPISGTLDGVTWKLIEAASWPTATSTVTGSTAPEKAETVAVPTRPSPLSLPCATPSSLV